MCFFSRQTNTHFLFSYICIASPLNYIGYINLLLLNKCIIIKELSLLLQYIVTELCIYSEYEPHWKTFWTQWQGMCKLSGTIFKDVGMYTIWFRGRVTTNLRQSLLNSLFIQLNTRIWDHWTNLKKDSWLVILKSANGVEKILPN